MTGCKIPGRERLSLPYLSFFLLQNETWIYASKTILNGLWYHSSLYFTHNTWWCLTSMCQCTPRLVKLHRVYFYVFFHCLYLWKNNKINKLLKNNYDENKNTWIARQERIHFWLTHTEDLKYKMYSKMILVGILL